MTTTRIRLFAVGAALIISSGGLSMPDASAAPAKKASCPSTTTFFDALSAKQRSGIWHHNKPSQAVQGLRCSSGWAVALVTAQDKHGNPLYSYEVLEHLSNRKWKVVDRSAACAHHQVPKKLYQEVCDGD